MINIEMIVKKIAADNAEDKKVHVFVAVFYNHLEQHNKNRDKTKIQQTFSGYNGHGELVEDTKSVLEFEGDIYLPPKSDGNIHNFRNDIKRSISVDTFDVYNSDNW